jgi:hypothetical protein
MKLDLLEYFLVTSGMMLTVTHEGTVKEPILRRGDGLECFQGVIRLPAILTDKSSSWHVCNIRAINYQVEEIVSFQIGLSL